jgi:hypothetical protein
MCKHVKQRKGCFPYQAVVNAIAGSGHAPAIWLRLVMSSSGDNAAPLSVPTLPAASLEPACGEYLPPDQATAAPPMALLAMRSGTASAESKQVPPGSSCGVAASVTLQYSSASQPSSTGQKVHQ